MIYLLALHSFNRDIANLHGHTIHEKVPPLPFQEEEEALLGATFRDKWSSITPTPWFQGLISSI